MLRKSLVVLNIGYWILYTKYTISRKLYSKYKKMCCYDKLTKQSKKTAANFQSELQRTSAWKSCSLSKFWVEYTILWLEFVVSEIKGSLNWRVKRNVKHYVTKCPSARMSILLFRKLHMKNKLELMKNPLCASKMSFCWVAQRLAQHGHL